MVNRATLLAAALLASTAFTTPLLAAETRAEAVIRNTRQSSQVELNGVVTVLRPEQQREVLCLALNIYHEARGSTLNDQMAVAFVTMNRVRSPQWADNVCGVVFERMYAGAAPQFSWTAYNTSRLVPRDQASWERAQRLAYEIYTGQKQDIIGGATHFFSGRRTPAWAHSGVNKQRIGGHLYMRMGPIRRTRG